MDIERFASELPRLFDDFPHSPTPRNRQFEAVLASIPGLAAENNLALVNLAASLLAKGESYVEVGTWQGRSLVSAALGNDADAVGIDDFSFRDGSRAELVHNLRHFGLEGVTVLEGDAFELLRRGALAGRQIGVYYYDAAHSYEQVLAGLRLVERYLAERALMIVDDSDWDEVGAASRAYIAGEERARLLIEIEGSGQRQPHWWEGVHVIAWEAESERDRGRGRVSDPPSTAS